MDIRAYLEKGKPLLFDGAMGTLYASQYGRTEQRVELANLLEAEAVKAIYRAYIEAGAKAIKTNTFTVSRDIAEGNLSLAEDLIREGVKIAKEAAGEAAFVFADLGPVPEDSARSAVEVYTQEAALFLKYGVTHFLVETLASREGMQELAAYLKANCPASFLIVSYAVSPEGITRTGEKGTVLFSETKRLPGVDAVGFNCRSGPNHLLKLIEGLDSRDTYLSVMPNAGYPTVLGRKMVYSAGAEYFGSKMAEIARAGAMILGGCCGTEPAYIKNTAKLLGDIQEQEVPKQAPKTDGDEEPLPMTNPLWDKLSRGERVVAVELDPPVNDDNRKFLRGVRELRECGVDAITIADCPIGRPRADSSILACKIKRELGVEPLPHMTCRDRNLNAIKALLLGLSMEDVHNVLLVTGDPIPSESREEVKSVFNFNSRKLIKYVSELNADTLQHPFRLFGALNLNANNFETQLRLAKEKEAAGVSGFLTQPVLSEEALENLKTAHRELKGKILAGIFPVVSHRNALFLNNEVSGIRVSEDIIRQYEGKSKEEGEDLAVRISAELIEKVTPYSDGIYLMTPFQRTGLIARILKACENRTV